jgi:endonuclease/exonuclease/phosphatase (EEP) superfamily protein YafD
MLTFDYDGKMWILLNIMPSDNSNRDEQYKDILSQLEEIIDTFQYQILLCGDFNASLHRDNRPRDKMLTTVHGEQWHETCKWIFNKIHILPMLTVITFIRSLPSS